MSKEEKKRAQGGKVGEWREEKVGTKSHGRPQVGAVKQRYNVSHRNNFLIATIFKRVKKKKPMKLMNNKNILLQPIAKILFQHVFNIK